MGTTRTTRSDPRQTRRAPNSGERARASSSDDPLLKLVGGLLLLTTLLLTAPVVLVAVALALLWRTFPWQRWWLPPLVLVGSTGALALWLFTHGWTLLEAVAWYVLGQRALLEAIRSYAPHVPRGVADPLVWLQAFAPPAQDLAWWRAYAAAVVPLAVVAGVWLACARWLIGNWGVGGSLSGVPQLRLRSRTTKQLLRVRVRRRPWAMHGYLRQGAITLLFSEPGGGKSEWAFALVAAMAALRSGQEGTFMGRGIRGGRVFILSEQSVDSLQDYAVRHRMHQGIAKGQVHWVTFDEVREVWHRHGGEGEPPWEAVAEWAQQDMKRRRCEIFVLDTYGQWVGETSAAENDVGGVRRAFAPLHAIKHAGLAVLSIMHTNKAGQLRGGNALKGQCDFAFKLSLVPQAPDTVRQLVREKSRTLGETPKVLMMDLTEDRGYVEWRSDPAARKGQRQRGADIEPFPADAEFTPSAAGPTTLPLLGSGPVPGAPAVPTGTDPIWAQLAAHLASVPPEERTVPAISRALGLALSTCEWRLKKYEKQGLLRREQVSKSRAVPDRWHLLVEGAPPVRQDADAILGQVFGEEV